MPNWTFHNDWATRLGVPRDIAKWVNVREDVPKFPEEEQAKFKGRVSKDPPSRQEMEKVSSLHLKAWILHLLIDELEDTLEYIAESEDLPPEEMIDATIDVLQFSPVVRILSDTGVEGEVKAFFLKHVREISTGVFKSPKTANPYIEIDTKEKNALEKEFEKISACTPRQCPFCGGTDHLNKMLVAPGPKATDSDFWVTFFCTPCERLFESNGKSVRERKT